MIRAAQPGEINGDAFDRFTLVHAASGIVAWRLGLGLPAVIALALAWEIGEDALKEAAPDVFPDASADSKQNALWDVVAMVGAFLVVARLAAR